jgi:hypothetical protein
MLNATHLLLAMKDLHSPTSRKCNTTRRPRSMFQPHNMTGALFSPTNSIRAPWTSKLVYWNSILHSFVYVYVVRSELVFRNGPFVNV